MKVAVIGIGRVGLPFAVVAARYHKVVGIDRAAQVSVGKE